MTERSKGAMAKVPPGARQLPAWLQERPTILAAAISNVMGLLVMVWIGALANLGLLVWVRTDANAWRTFFPIKNLTPVLMVGAYGVCALAVPLLGWSQRLAARFAVEIPDAPRWRTAVTSLGIAFVLGAAILGIAMWIG